MASNHTRLPISGPLYNCLHFIDLDVKRRHQTRGGNFVDYQPIFKSYSLSGSPVNLQQNIFIKDPTTPRMCVATLPCGTLMSENKRQSPANVVVINDNLQCTVVTYLRCGGLSITKVRKVYC